MCDARGGARQCEHRRCDASPPREERLIVVASLDLDYDPIIVGAGPQALVTRVGDRICALPIDVVEETMRPLPIAPVSGTPSCVLGVAVIRGRATPVVDGAVLVGKAPGHPRRFVTLRVGTRRVALAVDDVIGVRPLPAGELPPLVASAELVADLAMIDGELVVVLDATRVLAVVPDGVTA